MSKDFDKAMEELQTSIIEDARKVYSERVIEGWLNPKYLGEMENPEEYGKVTGLCGDTVKIFLKIDNDKVMDGRFLTDGCATTIAAGCMACELATGKTFREAFKITKVNIILPTKSTSLSITAKHQE